MKSLETIQKVSKFGKIFSKIVYVLCLVAVIILVISAVGVVLFGDQIVNTQDIVLPFVEKTDINISKAFICDALMVAIVGLLSEMYIAKKANEYFKFELELGTPFTNESADKMKKLGLTVIIVPIIATIISVIAHIVISKLLGNSGDIDINYDISLTMGLVFLFLSAVFRYGASLNK